MKKFFVILFALCVMASALSAIAVTTSAEETKPVVIRVAGMTENSQIILPESYTSFKDGWNRAADLAQKDEWMEENGIVRIVVDLYSDWVATSKDMGSGEGFEHGAIRVPGGTKMMINMNGHKISRNLSSVKANGEVIFIGKKADLIINGGQYRDSVVEIDEEPEGRKMGTITGGYSDNGAGGIHMDGNGMLTLNNVHLKENKVRGDDGAAVALYNSSTLIMNGGSITDSYMRYSSVFAQFTIDPDGVLYVKNSTAILNHVTINGSTTPTPRAEGMAIYATGSTVTMDHCLVKNNGIDGEGTEYTYSTIAAYNSKLLITDTDFIGNASYNEHEETYVFYLENSSLEMKGGNIKENNARELFRFKESDAELKGVTITDNTAEVLNVKNSSKTVNMIECVLGNNIPDSGNTEIRVKTENTLSLTDCDLGDTTFEDKSKISGVGSIFGEGSLAMIVSLVALIASVASIVVNVAAKKNTAASGKNDEE